MIVDEGKIKKKISGASSGRYRFRLGEVSYSGRYRLSPLARRTEAFRKILSWFAMTMGIICVIVVVYLVCTEGGKFFGTLNEKVQAQNAQEPYKMEITYRPSGK